MRFSRQLGIALNRIFSCAMRYLVCHPERSRRTSYSVFLAAVLPFVACAEGNRPTMKAIVVHEYGGPEVLKHEDVPRPEPKDNEILVRVVAAGVNPVDGLIRSGKYA